MANGGMDSISFQAQALQLYAERGRVLASNIANADTPNYKARDFDFQQALSGATSAAATVSADKGMSQTQAGHLPGATGTSAPTLLYRQSSHPSVDGNTVDLDAERANYAENSVRYEATLRFMNAQIRQMMTAINGQ